MTDRKELKQQYKERKPDMGVFAVRNLLNGRIFLGTTPDLHGALNSIRFRLKAGMHENGELQKDFSRLGEASFAFEVLDRIEPKEDPAVDVSDELKALGDLWLEKLQPYADRGYHRKPGT
jgi:hypothetical protein